MEHQESMPPVDGKRKEERPEDRERRMESGEWRKMFWRVGVVHIVPG